MSSTSRFTEHFDLDENQLCLISPSRSCFSSSTTSFDLFQTMDASSCDSFEKATTFSSTTSLSSPTFESTSSSNDSPFSGKLKRLLTTMSKKKKFHPANSE